tara:strand:+ start:134 stop:526 length:393 start_codon:yes stop_codon:yes gene_type:complete
MKTLKTFFQLRENLSGNTLNVTKTIYEAAVQMMNEKEDRKVTSDVEKKDSDAMYVSTHGTQHVYSGSQSDRENYTYLVHDTAKRKTHTFGLDHGGEVLSPREVKKAAGPSVSPATIKAITKHANDEIKMG